MEPPPDPKRPRLGVEEPDEDVEAEAEAEDEDLAVNPVELDVSEEVLKLYQEHQSVLDQVRSPDQFRMLLIWQQLHPCGVHARAIGITHVLSWGRESQVLKNLSMQKRGTAGGCLSNARQRL